MGGESEREEKKIQREKGGIRKRGCLSASESFFFFFSNFQVD